MSIQLKVHPSFFKEFATKTWISPYEIIKELVENAFDEDATKVLITVLNNGSIIVKRFSCLYLLCCYYLKEDKKFDKFWKIY